MYRYHKSLLTEPTSNAATSTAADVHVEEEEGTQDSEVGDQSPQENACCVEQATILGAQFILKTRDGRKLTQVATNGIVQDTKTVLQSTIEVVQKKVLETFESEEISLTDQQLEKITSIFADEAIVNPFRGLETEYKQDKFIQSHFDYVVSH